MFLWQTTICFHWELQQNVVESKDYVVNFAGSAYCAEEVV